MFYNIVIRQKAAMINKLQTVEHVRFTTIIIILTRQKTTIIKK
jgi:hypothetical protein